MRHFSHQPICSCSRGCLQSAAGDREGEAARAATPGVLLVGWKKRGKERFACLDSLGRLELDLQSRVAAVPGWQKGEGHVRAKERRGLYCAAAAAAATGHVEVRCSVA